MAHSVCIYKPGEPDWWGEFPTGKELFAMLAVEVPGLEYDAKASTEHIARYRKDDVLVVVMEQPPRRCQMPVGHDFDPREAWCDS